jgi:hypothetical protein
MAKKKSTKTATPYVQGITATEKINKIKTQIESILLDNKMALAPVVILTGDKVISRVDIVSTEQQS